jgi:hypothetical protein
MGEDSTDEASVRKVSRDPVVEARDRVVPPLSESSAEEWEEAFDEETCLMFEMSGAS